MIKGSFFNAFNSANRGLTLDVPNGRASRDYACGLLGMSMFQKDVQGLEAHERRGLCDYCVRVPAGVS